MNETNVGDRQFADDGQPWPRRGGERGRRGLTFVRSLLRRWVSLKVRLHQWRSDNVAKSCPLVHPRTRARELTFLSFSSLLLLFPPMSLALYPVVFLLLLFFLVPFSPSLFFVPHRIPTGVTAITGRPGFLSLLLSFSHTHAGCSDSRAFTSTVSRVRVWEIVGATDQPTNNRLFLFFFFFFFLYTKRRWPIGVIGV